MENSIRIIQEKRKNPILLLDLKEIQKPILLEAHNLLCKKKFKVLDVILQTPGGDADASFLLMKLLRTKAEKVNIIVPLYAKSAGTLMCLGADKILLTDLSELGPLDTQIVEQQDGGGSKFSSALNGFKALEQIQMHALETVDITTKLILSRNSMKIAEAIKLSIDFSSKTIGSLYSQFNPYKIGEYARVLEIGERYGIILLTRYLKWNKENAEKTVKTLVKRYPSHGFVLDLEELQQLNLPAEKIDNDLIESILHIRKELLETSISSMKLFELSGGEESDSIIENEI
ncbi:MAG: hypothetical protein HOG08_03275 [Candidatus Magasanikbacteria bacterium]|jgi:hypothetical protein|nr:hypothetical protein [Candidatus Magasanikbacteria bacterium]